MQPRTFADLTPAINPGLLVLESIRKQLKRCTPVQASVIPLLLSHKDVVVEAVTGSGKTLAFAVPIVQRLIEISRPFRVSTVAAVIVVPTRELASQVHKVLGDLMLAIPSTSTDHLPPPLLVTGGSLTAKQQAQAFHANKGPTVIIGTPGRLEELFLGQSSIKSNQPTKTRQKSTHSLPDLKTIDMVILDEADRLLDLGSAPVLSKLLAAFPKQRRTGCFSATMTDALMSDIVRVGMRNPVKVSVNVKHRLAIDSGGDSKRTPATLVNKYLVCRAEQKTAQLLRLITKEHNDGGRKVLIYFSTCASVDYFYQIFSKSDRLKHHSVFSLHGQQPPSRRAATFQHFSDATADRMAILLCTDVAARGLDLPDVDCVLQFDAPQDPRAFSHRCGRTARAGKAGRAYILLVKGREEEYIDFLNLRKIPLAKQPYLLSDGDDSEETPDIDEDADALLTEMRNSILTDRDLEEKSMKAYVSFVRSYSKHEASYVFRLAELDLAGVAKSYGLLRLPRMPELKGLDTSRWTNADVDWDHFAYSDPAREAKRQEEALLSRKRQQQPKLRSRPLRTEAWSNQKSKRTEQTALNNKRKGDVALPENTAKEDADEQVDAVEAEIRADERESKRLKRERSTKKQFMGSFDL